MERSVSSGRAAHPGRARAAVLSVGVAAAIFVGGTFLAPLLTESGSASGELLRLFYSPLCHQLTERSLAVGPGYQAVCARCAGLYLGGLAGIAFGACTLAVSGRVPRRFWLVVAAAPTLADAALPWLGGSGVANLPRMLLALPAGAVAGAFLAVGVADLTRSQARETSAPNNQPVVEGVDG